LNARKLISNRSRRTPKASFLFTSDPRFAVSKGLPGWWQSTRDSRKSCALSFLFFVSLPSFRSSRELFWWLLYFSTHSCCVLCAQRLLSGERTYYIGIVLFIELSNNRRKFASRRIIHPHSTNYPERAATCSTRTVQYIECNQITIT
jgi:hypothetical protein